MKTKPGIGDVITPVVSSAVLGSDEMDKLKKLLQTSGLTERERKVIELRFGLNGGIARTLKEIGDQFNVTRERIRQIETKAMRKMRMASGPNGLDQR